MLDLPQLAARRIDREALAVAVAVTPDLRFRIGAAGERIVSRCRSVRRDADDLAEVIAEQREAIAELTCAKASLVVELRDAFAR